MSLLLLFVSQQETTEPGDCDLLTESGGSLLQESGDALLLEDCGDTVRTHGRNTRRYERQVTLVILDDEDALFVTGTL